jgi:hypothetical protein
MTTVGMPLEAVAQMRTQPWWAGLEAVAPTLAYDSEIMGDLNTGGTIPTDLIGRVTAPATRPLRREPRVDDRRRQADRGGSAERMPRRPGGSGARRAPGVLVPVFANFFAA